MKETIKQMAKRKQKEQNDAFESHIIITECRHYYYRIIKGKFNKNGQTARECRNCGVIF